MVANTKFAPGPWHVIWPMAAGLGMSRPGIDAGNQTIIEAGAEDDDCGVFGYTPQECDANARIIAAAPDLAEALKEFVSLMLPMEQINGMTPTFQAALDAARAALKRAGVE